MSESFYNILGVPETASKDEIKKAYRVLSLKLHPDRNPNNLDAVSKFQKINEAYETLGDEQKKEEYDMMNKNPFFKMAQQGGGQNMGMPFQDMDDIFSALFGNVLGSIPGMQQGMHFGGPGGPKIHVFRAGGSHQFPPLQKPTPIIKTITISMEQVLTGGTIPVDIERWLIEGENKLFENETIYVTIPKGIDDNEIIMLREKGNILNEDIKGDIKLFVKIENTSQFERKGIDLIMNKNISLKDALCGFSFELKYINGKVYTLNNNSGSIIPPEYIKIIPNMGLTRDGHTGNLLIHFHVDFPEKLSEEQIKGLKEIL
jgi:DnaJ family protein B protein 4